ncbi:MAG: DUF4157 domain-containing protein [Chitinophagales bacterium]
MNALLHHNNLAVKPAMTFAKTKPVVQAKLTVNEPGDIYEQEAEAMADRVMRMSSNEATKPVTGLIGKSLQRKCAHCEEEEKKKKPIMRKAEAGNSGMSVSTSFASSLNASKGGGSPLPQGTKSFMENAFSTDFSEVRIHTGSKASEMSRGINSKAFTHGNDIYFNAGQYKPNTHSGKSLLAHELTHTIHQNTNQKSIGSIQRFADCNVSQNQMIRDGLTRARRRSTRAIRAVTNLQNGSDRSAAGSLARFFGEVTSAQITIILDRMNAADGQLNNPALWKCDTAATYSHCGPPNPWCAGTLCPSIGAITHLCPRVFNEESSMGCVESSRSILLQHEALRAAGVCGGVQPPGDMTSPGSINNIFSYSRFMYSIASGSR